MYERRIYLPALFLALICGRAIGALSSRYRPVIVPALLVLALFLAWGFNRNLVWQDPIRLWKEATRLASEHSRPYHNLGVLYQEQREWEPAKKNFRRAKKRA